MSKDKLFTLIPLEDLEQEAQNQIWNALGLPFLEKLAIMPDCHTGYSLPIGGVALLNEVISPAHVGYDIGCGMCCIVTNIPIPDSWDLREKRKIQQDIMNLIPVGFNHHKSNVPNYKEFKSASGDKELNKLIAEKLEIQLGTLGGGK